MKKKRFKIKINRDVLIEDLMYAIIIVSIFSFGTIIALGLQWIAGPGQPYVVPGLIIGFIIYLVIRWISFEEVD